MDNHGVQMLVLEEQRFIEEVAGLRVVFVGFCVPLECLNPIEPRNRRPCRQDRHVPLTGDQPDESGICGSSVGKVPDLAPGVLDPLFGSCAGVLEHHALLAIHQIAELLVVGFSLDLG